MSNKSRGSRPSGRGDTGVVAPIQLLLRPFLAAANFVWPTLLHTFNEVSRQNVLDGEAYALVSSIGDTRELVPPQKVVHVLHSFFT